ncbi:hypothetical protein [Roseomonas chloroacetimidivorans]|uniref:hypothetical protein n=1 Tax=Roseomonas chloroacetimidivorans TaxID=1766656 RepID=UPI003C76514E
MAYKVTRGGKLEFTATPSGPHGARFRGDRNRRVMAEFTRDGIEYSYHATKGWRRKRVGPSVAANPSTALPLAA